MPPQAAVLVLLLAALLDYGVGDPWGWPHPVRVMGWVIQRYTQIALQALKTCSAQRWAGVVLGVGLIGGSAFVGWLAVQGAYWLHPALGVAIAGVLLSTCFAGRSLRAAAEDVLDPLQRRDLDVARTRLSRYVGRDTHALAEPEVLRAVLETVAENTTDGVTAPLFYALLGLIVPVGSLPLALAYKATSTLDSMIGYREAPYTDIGWFSARVEDVLTWLPCRLTVITLALLSGRPRSVWRLCQRDASADPSPNAGWSECAYAAVLQVQLGGTNWYRGVAKQKPLLGDPTFKITPASVHRALALTRACFLGWLAAGALMYYVPTLLVQLT